MKRSLILSLSAPFVFILAACAPEHATVSPIKTQTTAASVNTVLNHQDWPKNEWWKAYNDPQLNGLIAKALSDAPDMQIARQRITLAEAQAKNIPVVAYGAFFNNCINFIIQAWAVFILIKIINKLKPAAPEAPKAEPRLCPFCFMEIDEHATRCPHCTSELPEPTKK